MLAHRSRDRIPQPRPQPHPVGRRGGQHRRVQTRIAAQMHQPVPRPHTPAHRHRVRVSLDDRPRRRSHPLGRRRNRPRISAGVTLAHRRVQHHTRPRQSGQRIRPRPRDLPRYPGESSATRAAARTAPAVPPPRRASGRPPAATTAPWYAPTGRTVLGLAAARRKPTPATPPAARARAEPMRRSRYRFCIPCYGVRGDGPGC